MKTKLETAQFAQVYKVVYGTTPSRNHKFYSASKEQQHEISSNLMFSYKQFKKELTL